MLDESALVPFATGHLDGSPVLVLAPHPDDEVLACGGAVALAVRAGAVVHTVVVTDGAAQGDGEVRRQESVEAARRLGCPPPTFWGLPDRQLVPDDGELRDRLRQCLLELRPRVILVPSPAEVHPDHRALALATYRLLQTAFYDPPLEEAVQGVRLVAWEVSGVLRPNLLVDVSDVWDDVLAAAKTYSSQLGVRPYDDVMDGLARARRLTLPESVRRAEAYHAVDLRWIRTRAASEWAAAQGPADRLETVSEVAPIDVVVRTRNRPELLAEALQSLVVQQAPPNRVIVVNDGGVSVDATCAPFAERISLGLIENATSKGRSRAAQAGLERCTASHVVFLDDDDRLFPEHLSELGRAVARGVTVPYTDAVQGVWQRSDSGSLECVGRHRTFHLDFDRDLLRAVNAIPLLTVALPRELTMDVGGFDPDMDLYEDWDLLLRVADRTPFVHLRTVTCEYRTVLASESISVANPPGSAGQVAAMQSVWERHGVLSEAAGLVRAVLALVAERDQQAERARRLDEELTAARGDLDGAEGELGRLRSELSLERQDLQSTVDELERVRGEEARLTAASSDLAAEVERLHGEERSWHGENERLRGEVERLTGVVQQLRGSLAWKLHRLSERLRGRG